MIVKNVTSSVQSIEFINGESVSVLSNCECDIDENKIYDFELKRVLKVFDEVKNKKIEIPVETKKIEVKGESKKEKVKDDFFDGGIK
ncbi:MAG: hypothetical protein KOO69_02490 [Victivallales bacterium]|nr:hypothetical protein [Victivallales bacterium]